MKKNIFVIILVVVLSGCSVQTKNNQTSHIEVVVPEVDHEYFEVNYITINWSDIFKENKESYYIYIYSLTCSHCEEFKNWIISTALERDDIYFVKGTNAIKIKNDISSTIGATDTSDLAILGYPSLLEINQKKLVKNIAGATKIKEALVNS